MYHRQLTKPDGRALHLYSSSKIPEGITATSPLVEAQEPNPHLRWHCLRGEWVAYASHRQNRTFLPPPEYSPLAVTTSSAAPTELPSGNYEVAVFENLFPSLTSKSHNPPSFYTRTEPAQGACEVIVYSQDRKASLGNLPLKQVELIIQVWAHRYEELSRSPNIAYVMPFENRGAEVGVTIFEPHGQIYAYPFIPPVPLKMLRMQKDHLFEKGTGLLETIVQEEIKDGRRVLMETKSMVAFVPVFARYPYECWIVPRQATASLNDLTREERTDLAKTLKCVLQKYDGLWNRPFPYLMSLHQAPTREKFPKAHFHFEFHPPYRTKDRLKYLAGTELAAGMFANDSLPEEKAAELRAVEVEFE